MLSLDCSKIMDSIYMARIDQTRLNCDLIVDRLRLGQAKLCPYCNHINAKFGLTMVYIVVRLRLLLWIDLIYIVYRWWINQAWIQDELWLDNNYIEIVAILCLAFDKIGARFSLYCRQIMTIIIMALYFRQIVASVGQYCSYIIVRLQLDFDLIVVTLSLYCG